MPPTWRDGSVHEHGGERNVEGFVFGATYDQFTAAGRRAGHR